MKLIKKVCPNCNGKGKYLDDFFNKVEECYKCNSSGKVLTNFVHAAIIILFILLISFIISLFIYFSDQINYFLEGIEDGLTGFYLGLPEFAQTFLMSLGYVLLAIIILGLIILVITDN